MRMQPDDRREMIVQAALSCALKDGLSSVTFDTVAMSCPVDTSTRTVRHYFNTLSSLWLTTAKRDRKRLWCQAVKLGVAK